MAPIPLEKRREVWTEEEMGVAPPPRRQWARSWYRLLPVLVILGLLLAAVPQVQRSCWRQGSPILVSGDQPERDAAGSASRSHHLLTTLDDVVEEDQAALKDASGREVASRKREDASASSPEAAKPTVLECFQVAQPVLGPRGATTSDGTVSPTVDSPDGKSCTVLLMDHVFAWSYGMPFIGNYVPPNCEFNRVVMNFTAVSQGRQFDRLALMYFGDTEVWRTSTAEPVVPPGIRWVYLKDMTEYMYFWKSPQKIIFDLGNLIDDKYTGSFNTTLTATFFKSDVKTDQAPPSDLIIPISTRNSSANAISQFTLPEQNATNTISFPRNANRAVFSVSANGQADEEFWWSNVLESDRFTFNKTAGEFPALSPFREVQVYIDGRLSGVQWPFPVIFTGGVVPSFHRPIVGIQAFDLREHEIDITPWLPILCDGKQHTFTIQVAGLDDDGKTTATLTQQVDKSWYVTGKIFVWLDSEGSVTTGEAPTVAGLQPTIQVSHSIHKNSTGGNQTLDYSTEVQRIMTVTGKTVTQKSSETVSWSQMLSYSNKGRITGYGANQINEFSIKGTDKSTGPNPYSAIYEYPLFCNSTTQVSAQGNLTLRASLHQEFNLQVAGSTVFPTGLEAFPKKKYAAAVTSTYSDGTAAFFQTGDGKNSSGYGTRNQVFHFGGVSSAGVLGSTPDVELYFRNVTAANNTVLSNKEVIAGAQTKGYTVVTPPGDDAFRGLFAQAPNNGGKGPRVFLGRGGQDPTKVDDDGMAAGGS